MGTCNSAKIEWCKFTFSLLPSQGSVFALGTLGVGSHHRFCTVGSRTGVHGAGFAVASRGGEFLWNY